MHLATSHTVAYLLHCQPAEGMQLVHLSSIFAFLAKRRQTHTHTDRETHRNRNRQARKTLFNKFIRLFQHISSLLSGILNHRCLLEAHSERLQGSYAAFLCHHKGSSGRACTLQGELKKSWTRLQRWLQRCVVPLSQADDEEGQSPC